MTAYTDSTTAGYSDTCAQCRSTYVVYGGAMKWTWVNGYGPFCERCMVRGVTIKGHVINGYMGWGTRT